jgi:hypothetical protein
MKRARGRCPICASTQFAVEFDNEDHAVKARCYYNGCPPRAILAALTGTVLDQLKQGATDKLQDRARNRAAARRGWNFSRAVEDTLGEQYLRQIRGISTARLPSSLRYNASVFHHRNERGDYYSPALIACAETTDGKFAGINRTYLDPASPDLKLNADPQKATLGTEPGAVVRLTPALSDKIVLCEGIEDGLAIVQMHGLTTWATLGTNPRSVRLPDCVSTVILAADNDAPGRRAVEAAAKHFHAQGRQVRIVYPRFGKDFNEELLARK